MSDPIRKVGFIGIGIMGLPMARNLMQSGFELTVYNRTASRCDSLVAEGAKIARSPRESAEGQDAVITMVTDTPDVEQVLLGEEGVILGVGPGAIVIDMSTISPKATRRFAAALTEKQVGLLDAPVSGGDVGAQKGTLTIMVGGEVADFERAQPLFAAMGKTITRTGSSGSGQSTKLCNQVLVAIHLMGVCECLTLAKKSGLDLPTTLKVLTGGAANSWSLENLGPRIAAGDHAPGFMVKLLLKDLKLVVEAAADGDLPLPTLALAQQMFVAVSALEGGGELGTQGVIRAYERLTGVTVH